MKKALVSILLVITLCACSGGEIKPCLGGISFTAEMVYYNESYSFEGELSVEGELTAVMTAPEELKDLKFTLNAEGTVVDYKGITYTPTAGTMPFSKTMESFYAPVKEVLQGGLTADSKGILTLGEGVEAATFTLSPTGLPQKLEIPDKRFCVTFYNVSLIEDVND